VATSKKKGHVGGERGGKTAEDTQAVKDHDKGEPSWGELGIKTG